MAANCKIAQAQGAVILEKLKAMGFAEQPLDEPIATHCQDCGYAFKQQTCAFYCPACGLGHVLTPCACRHAEAIQAVR